MILPTNNDTQVGVVTHHLQFLLFISLLLAIVGIINTEHQRQEPSGEQGQENPGKLQLKVALEVVPGSSNAGSGLEERKRWMGRAQDAAAQQSGAAGPGAESLAAGSEEAATAGAARAARKETSVELAQGAILSMYKI